jgi:hypothetical protein
MQKCVSVSVLTSDQEQWFQCEILLHQPEEMTNGELIRTAEEIAQDHVDYFGDKSDEPDNWDDSIDNCYKIEKPEASYFTTVD